MYKTLLTFIFFSTSWFFFAQDVNKISVQAAKHDVNDLIATIESVHYNPFHRIDKFTLIRIKDSIFREWSKDSISYREFTKSGMYLTSLMSNGHTSFDWQNPALFPELISSSFLPLKVKIKEDELIVTSSSCNDIKEGDIIKFIDEIKISKLDFKREVIAFIEPSRVNELPSPKHLNESSQQNIEDISHRSYREKTS